MSRHFFLTILLIAITTSGCFIHHDQSKVLISGIDIDQTLDVAQAELNTGEWSSVLTLWAMRDQVITPEQANRVYYLYFKFIDTIDSDAQKKRKFAVWHLTWAISNMYRLGDEDVKLSLQGAYDDAAKRVKKIDRRVAEKHFFDDELLMGDIHGGGRSYAKKHLVVPGNKKYLQSKQEYFDKNRP